MTQDLYKTTCHTQHSATEVLCHVISGQSIICFGLSEATEYYHLASETSCIYFRNVSHVTFPGCSATDTHRIVGDVTRLKVEAPR
jgi:hypothetical protein